VITIILYLFHYYAVIIYFNIDNDIKNVYEIIKRMTYFANIIFIEFYILKTEPPSLPLCTSSKSLATLTLYAVGLFHYY